MNLADERIERLSEKLHLPDVPALLGALAQEAVTKEWSFSDFAEVLLQAQADAADARAADTIQRLAGFPVRKTLDEFDYSCGHHHDADGMRAVSFRPAREINWISSLTVSAYIS